MKVSRVWVVAAGAGLAAACQAQWVSQPLNSLAVTNASGQMVVLHDGGGHYQNNPIYAPACVFDGNDNTFYDAANGQSAWVGFGLQEPKLITRIRYRGRSGYARRVPGTLVQGANMADFSDAVTLWELQPPADWNPTQWRDEQLLSPAAATNSFTYVRLQCTMPDSCGGDFSRVEFYGADPQDPNTPPPDTPSVTLGEVINYRMNLRWAGDPSSVILYEIERKIAHEAGFSPLGTFFAAPGTHHYHDASLTVYQDTEYRIRAFNVAGVSAWTNVTGLARNAASGQWVGTPGYWGNTGNSGTHAFDGNVMTEVNGSSADGFWTGLDFGRERELVGVRFVPRSSFPERMVGGVFEAADNPDFTNATVFYTVTNTPPIHAITEAALASPVTTRYARYYPPPNGFGDISELEFVQAPTGPNPPNGLAIATSDITNAFAILTWRLSDVGSLVSSVMVYRATSAGGPYALMTPDGIALSETAWTDTAVLPGVRYYYRLASLLNTGAGPIEGDPCAHVTHISNGRVERDWSDLTQIRPGMDLLGLGYLTYRWNEADAFNYLIARMFDNDTGSFPDTSATPNNGGFNPAVGVDLGKPHVIRFVRAAPRVGYLSRFNGTELRGSNDPDYTNNFVRLLTFSGAVAGELTTHQTVTQQPFRYIFAQRPDAGQFYGNISELELYGFATDAADHLLIAPAAVALSIRPEGVRLDWEAGAAQDAYRVERSAAGIPWADIGGTLTGTFTDADPILGQRAFYRVVAVRGANPEEQARSDAFSIIAYMPANGTGLAATYFTHFDLAYNPAEQWAGTFVEPAPDYWINETAPPFRPDVPGSAENFRVVWDGRLIVPFAGDWTLYVTSDDGAALWVDGACLINRWVGRAATTDQVTLPLAAGEHTIRIDYFQGGGGKAMRLEWGGAVDRAVIPATQLLPPPQPSGEGVFAQAGPWLGRTFGAQRLGYHTLNPDGSVTVASAGSDIWQATESFHYAWQTVSGDFFFEATVDIAADPRRTTSKVMLMVRDALPVGSRFLASAAIPNAGVWLNVVQRTELATQTSEALAPSIAPWGSSFPGPFRLRVKRIKGTFAFAYRDASPGSPWVTYHTFEDTAGAFGRTLFAGFAVSGPGTGEPMFQTATFSDISLKPLNGTVLLLR